MSIYFKVSGRVQGVSFRATTQEAAWRLGVSGWVRNCTDGSVEGMASGSDEALEAFRQWLSAGPDYARVDHLEVRPLTPDEQTLLPTASANPVIDIRF